MGKAFNEHLIQNVEDVIATEITQFYIKTGGSENEDRSKMEALASIYDSLTLGQSIVFVIRKDTADKLEEFLQARDLACAKFHSDVDQAVRKQRFNEFKDGKRKVLIATDLLSRGIDVPAMSLVVNYDFPMNHKDGTPAFDTYQQRIGRCGRFGRKGCAFTFVHTRTDQNFVDQTAAHFGCVIKEITEEEADDPEVLVEIVKKAQDPGRFKL
jgi:ATP-dependent RNA helicase DDX19/DBP5